jgi:hypothetical protein
MQASIVIVGAGPAVETDPGTNDQIDAAYGEKYRHYSAYVPPMISPEALATTLRLTPRSTSA